MSRLSSLFRRTLVAGALVAAAFLSLPQDASAGVGSICYYYDANNQLVGARGYDCCGRSVSWGLVTQNSLCFAEYCASCP